ncbi:TPA: hypothetical protein N2Y18_003772 [Escherichia coli]|nr:hypothetical protein [Escherichia coli]
MKNNTQPALKERIEKALEDFTKGRASMHVPPLDTDVDVVLAECSDRLSELKARCAALAAENAGLKAVESNLVRNIINDLGDTEFQYEKVQTPATDAFLDEVRAQGVVMCSAEIQKQTWDEREGDGMVAAIDAMEIYALQLRKGVQS